MIFRKICSILSIFLPFATLLVATNSYSATATWSISASIGQVDSELQPYFSVGDRIAGSMVVEEHSGCSGGVNFSCTYLNSVQSLLLNTGAYSFSGLDPIKNGIIFIKDGSESEDHFKLIFATPNSNSSNFGDVTFNNLYMLFSDITGAALSSNALTLIPPNSLLFDSTELSLYFSKITPVEGGFQISTPSVKAYNLQLNMVSAVPEPQPYTLLLAGLWIIGLISRRA